MILLSLLYLWLDEPMGFQKEASVRAEINKLGTWYVLPEHRHFLAGVNCVLDIAMTREFGQMNAVQSFEALGPGGIRDLQLRGSTVYDCRIPNPCGTVIDLAFAHQSFAGVYTLPYESIGRGESFWKVVGTACPEMVTEGVRKVLNQMQEQGG